MLSLIHIPQQNETWCIATSLVLADGKVVDLASQYSHSDPSDGTDGSFLLLTMSSHNHAKFFVHQVQNKGKNINKTQKQCPRISMIHAK
jgi:hypothetical protein